MIFEHRFLVAEYCPGLKKGDLAGSLFALFSERYHLVIAGCDEVVLAVLVWDTIARILMLVEVGAGFLLRSVEVHDNGQPLSVEDAVHRPDGFELRNRVVPTRPVQEVRLQPVVPAVDSAETR